MASVLGSLLSWLLSRLFGKAPPRSQEAVQSERVGADEVKLQTVETTNVQVTQAVQAERQSDARYAVRPDELRSPSPDSRD